MAIPINICQNVIISLMQHDLYLWLSKKLYFPTSKYFRFFAALVLKRWRPKIIAVIGSAGKSNATKLFYLLLKQKYSVRKSQRANSAFAIPLDILDIHLRDYNPRQWLWAAVRVPFYTLYRLVLPFREKYYVCELDVDRPGEMAFFASFIRPEVIFWVSSYATHTANFDKLIKRHHFKDSASAVAAEFAKLFRNRKQLMGIINADSKYVVEALRGKKFQRFSLQEKQGPYQFRHWRIFRKRTVYRLRLKEQKVNIELPFIAPRNFGYTVLAAYLLKEKLKISDRNWDQAVAQFEYNPGICSVLSGLNNTKIIDSSYNSSLYATKSLLEVLDKYPGKRKIAVLGDMRELGKESGSQHRRLADTLLKYRFDQVVLVGPEMQKYVYPLLQKKYADTTLHSFNNTYQAGLFIKERLLKTGDVILLKASQNTLFFEIIAELLLANGQDIKLLCRRDSVWEKKRQAIRKEFYSCLE